MLQTNPETICRLVELARSVHVREPATIPETPNSPADDWGRQMLADQPDNASAAEFKTIIEDLEPDQQQEVVALHWLGREDYSIEEWPELLVQAKQQWTPETAEYLLRDPLLADQLQEALSAHGYNCQDSNFISHN